MKVAAYITLILALSSCSEKVYKELSSKCELQSTYDKISYKVVYKNASSFDMDTVITTTRNYLTHSQGDTIYPYEFLNVDEAGNYISYADDTVFSYNTAFGGKYYDLAKIYRHEMVSDGYKYNTLLPEVCKSIIPTEEVKWEKSKKENVTTYRGVSNVIDTQYSFDNQDHMVSSQYVYWSASFHYYGQHTFSEYLTDFNTDILDLMSGTLIDYETYRKQQEDFVLEREKNLVKFPVFNDLDGQEVNITEKENLYILDFFFNGCRPCIESVPKLNELYKAVGEEVPMYGINGIDKSAESIKNFKARFGVQYPLLMADRKFISSVRINSYPELLVIKDGEIVYRHIGTLHTIEDLLEFLEEL